MEILDALVSTEWLAQHQHRENLKLIDVSVKIIVNEDSISTKSGREKFEARHIPTAQFIDLPTELSDSNSALYYALPSETQFSSVIGRLGIKNDDSVILYTDGYTGWATRLWWLFRVFGFDRVAVLDGGLRKWKRENRPLESGPAKAPKKTKYNARLNPDLRATKASVLNAVTTNADCSCVIDSLEANYFNGAQGDRLGYGRIGHITGAVNQPADNLFNLETGEFLSIDDLEEKFATVIKDKTANIITYCGGGIAATLNAFALYLLGYKNVAVYDGSLQEWAKDESLPMET